MEREYPALIHKDATSDYGVSFPDFPGCISAGATPEEALELAKEALQFHIEGMLEDGESIPEPSTLSDHMASDEFKSEAPLFYARIPIRFPSRAKRINVTIDENLLRDIDTMARTVGMNRSAFLAEGARQYLNTLKK